MAHGPAWMSIAVAESGMRGFGQGESNPRIVEYNGHANLMGYDDRISWCSSFINGCFGNAGIPGTGSALARPGWSGTKRSIAPSIAA